MIPIKTIIIIVTLIIIIFIGSGFITNKTTSPSLTVNEVREANIRRLKKADQHLQTVTQPNNIKKQIES